VLRPGERLLTDAERAANPKGFHRYGAAAKAKLPWLPAEWEWFAWDGRTAGVIRLKGGVPLAGVENAKRWKGAATMKVIVTDAEVAAAVVAYEADTGNCADCSGTGETFASAGPHGVTVRKCSKCAGSGRAVSR
jgi:hypothetical protein